MKRYSLHYMAKDIDYCISEEYVLGQYDRTFGYSNSLKALRGCVPEIVRRHPDATNFRIYDHIYDSIEVNAYRHPVCRRSCIGAKWENC